MKLHLHISLLILLGFGLSLISCRHEALDDLELVFTKRAFVEATYENEWQYSVEEGFDWENYSEWEEVFHMSYEMLRPALPDGLRAQISLENGFASVFNMSPEGGEIPFADTHQSLLFYNNNTEFIVFDGLHSVKEAVATTRSRSEGARPGIMDGMDGDAMNSPDMLYTYYIESFHGEEHPDDDVIAVRLKPMVFSYLIQYEFQKGLEDIVQAKGALVGMADAVSLSDGRTSSNTATLLFNGVVRNFAVQALVHSFGIPAYPNEEGEPDNRKYALELDVKLKSGNVQHFRFDVSDQVSRQPRGGVVRITGIEVDEKLAHPSYDSGFDVNVSGWGEDEHIQLPI